MVLVRLLCLSLGLAAVVPFRFTAAVGSDDTVSPDLLNDIIPTFSEEATTLRETVRLVLTTDPEQQQQILQYERKVVRSDWVSAMKRWVLLPPSVCLA